MNRKNFVLQEYVHVPKDGDVSSLRLTYQEGDDGVFFTVSRGKTHTSIKLSSLEVHDLIMTLEGVSKALRQVRTSRLTQKREDYLKKRAEAQKPQSVAVESYDMTAEVMA